MQIVHTLNDQLWRKFVHNHPNGNIFQTPEMFRIFAQTKGHRPVLWAAVDGHNRPLALLLCVQITLMDGFLRRFTTRAVAYGSILAATEPEGRAALQMLLQAYNRQAQYSYLFTELRNLADLSELQPALAQLGYTYQDHLNYLINLNRPAEEILQSIGKRTRKKIRKGLRDGMVEIKEATNQADLEHWYKILQKTYNNARVPLADRSLFEAAFNELYPKGMAKFLLARVKGVTAACSVELLYKDTIYGWYGGSDREFSQYLPNEMLIWHILEWGANNNYRVYDFGGAGKPGEEYGVRDFKAKFGGQLVNFGRNICVHRPALLAISKQGYKLYRRFL